MARSIGGLFGRSAFGPLYEHLVQVAKTTRLLGQIVAEFAEGEHDLIDREEGVADEIKEEIRRHLSHSFFSAVERSDTLLLLGLQDDVADNANDTAKMLSVRATPLPEPLHRPFLDLAEASVNTTELLLEHSGRIFKLLEENQGRDQVTDAAERLGDVRSAEFEAQEGHRRFLERLFAIESSLDPVTVVLLMNIARQLEQVSHSAEKTAECLERMIAQR